MSGALRAIAAVPGLDALETELRALVVMLEPLPDRFPDTMAESYELDAIVRSARDRVNALRERITMERRG